MNFFKICFILTIRHNIQTAYIGVVETTSCGNDVDDADPKQNSKHYFRLNLHVLERVRTFFVGLIINVINIEL